MGDRSQPPPAVRQSSPPTGRQSSEHSLSMSPAISRRQFLTVTPMLVAVAGVATGFATTYLIEPRWHNPSLGSTTDVMPSVSPVDTPTNALSQPQPPVELAGVRLASQEELAATGKSVFVHCYKAELGQGVETIFAMLVGEELNTPLAQIGTQRITNPDELGHTATVASDSVRALWQPLRELGGMLAGWLIDAAAKQWSVPPKACVIGHGQVTNTLDDRSLYWHEVVDLVATPLRKKVQLKKLSECQLLGQSQTSIDIEAIVSGQRLFTQDIRFPHSTTVMLQRSPSPWHRWISDNRNTLLEAANFPDLIAIELIQSSDLPHGREAILIAGESVWAVMKAKQALRVVWQREALPQGFANIEAYHEYLKSLMPERAEDLNPTHVAAERQLQERRLTANFWLPYLPHQTLEPPCCSLSLSQDRCEIWLPTQRAAKARAVAAQLLNMNASAIQLHPQRVGGGFGRKANTDTVTEAIIAAQYLMRRAAGHVSVRPLEGTVQSNRITSHNSGVIRLMWDREDDIQHDFYRPASMQQISVTLKRDGGIKQWIHTIAFPEGRSLEEEPSIQNQGLSMGAKPLLYTVDEHSVKRIPVKAELAVGIWRSVHFTQHTHAIESVIERIAKRHSVHPLDYRIKHLKGLSRLSLGAVKASFLGGGYQALKMKRVLDALASARQDVKKRPGVGYAAVYAFGTYVAAAVEVLPTQKAAAQDADQEYPDALSSTLTESSMDDTNNASHLQKQEKEQSDVAFQVKRVTVVVDAGFIVNPDGAKAQVEGSIVFGLSAALYGDMTTKNATVMNENFHDTPLLRIDQQPAVEIHLLGSEDAPMGLGEPVVPVISPALCNAVVDLRGTEEISLPLLV